MLGYLRILAPWWFCMVAACATSEDVGDDKGGGGGGFGGTPSGGGGAGGTPSGGGGSGATAGLGATGGIGGTPGGGAAGTGGTSAGGAGGTGGSGGSVAGGGGTSGGGGGGPACAVLGCADGNESGAGCAGARVVGRLTAAKAGGFQVTTNTCSSANDVSGYDATSCKDLGRDRSYRMYLKKFEKLDVKLTQGAKCASAQSWERVFKIYSGSNCTDQACDKKHLCGNTGAGTWGTTFVAPDDGWYVIVVDGQKAPGAGDDSGDFTLTLQLLCVFGGCEC
ncbi:MAG: hypothetical protein IPI67_37460 [Myxococcales bacterium]|nr:hypothetical protein [Myxococcales bacterium]